MQPRPDLVIAWVESAVVSAGSAGVTLREVQEFVWRKLPPPVRESPEVLSVGAGLSSALGSLKRARRIYWEPRVQRWFSVDVEAQTLPIAVQRG